MFNYLLLALFAYLLGSIPFGLLLTRAAGLGDIRKTGSGNIGATNVLRTGNKGIAALTLLLDGFKGFLPVALAMRFMPEAAGSIMIYALIGHCFSVWLNFKGGKGVATYIGAMFGLSGWFGLAACAIWLAVAFTSRISSLAALVMVATMPILALFFLGMSLTFWLILAAFLIAYQHRANIARLKAGTEPKIGA